MAKPVFIATIPYIMVDQSMVGGETRANLDHISNSFLKCLKDDYHILVMVADVKKPEFQLLSPIKDMDDISLKELTDRVEDTLNKLVESRDGNKA